MQNYRLFRSKIMLTGCAVAICGATGLVAQLRQSDSTDGRAGRASQNRARNVILFLGDGMGDSEITIARNYEAGANGRLWMDSLPYSGEYTTYALQESNPSKIDYVTDSAASGTGWATGVKTSNGRISSVAGTGNAATRLQTILELAQRAGFKTGNVSTAEITDATPPCSIPTSSTAAARGRPT
jgi:alkaline phosphatase